MRVKRNQLIEGCILAEDIFVSTNQPIIRKKTVLTPQQLQIMDIFLVDQAVVEKNLSNGQPFAPVETIEDSKELQQEYVVEKTFLELYEVAVNGFKRLFMNWQSGVKVDIWGVRRLILPLIEKEFKNANDILRLHHLSTKEDYLYHHAVAVAVLSAFLAQKLNYSKGDWIQVGIAGLLSDSGMSKVPERIINKKGPLTNTEIHEIRKHSIHSYNMLKPIHSITEGILLGVLQHHERLDGSGYPLKINGEKLHPFSHIIAVADVYHAMTSERLYRKKQSPYRVIEALTKEQFGKFEHRIVQTLIEGVITFSLGATVRLSTGEVGTIIFIDQQQPTRPIIKLDSGEMLNLMEKNDIYIEEELDL
ncbi:HD-GYP domain-containing protein [Anaerobacillus sp. MEB173]|uniref:HD-GYP domain-containing protein n=1 Tax=Anaerobacillus sp. MEB173 TaxID=3383345 RepID=UPI003F8E26B4